MSKDQRPKTKDLVNWNSVRRVLVIRLRSIGDTVLATPSLIALRRFLPESQIDILLEDWVAPLLDGFDAVDNVIPVNSGRGGRLAAARRIRRNKYDVVFNLHGGTTATFLTYASGAPHRVGYSHYQYSFLHNHLLSSSADFWKTEKTHSAEQQLAQLGFVGVPVDDRPKSRLVVTQKARSDIERRLTAETPEKRGLSTNGERNAETPLLDRRGAGFIRRGGGRLALLHPTAAYYTKQWPVENFARIAEYLAERGFQTVAVAAKHERSVLDELQHQSSTPMIVFDDLSLPEITALASRAALFVGNDSGIAHIAAAVNTPTVVIFGSSNRDHWRPWTDAPNEIVFEEFPCQPCPGYECKEFGDPKCILKVDVDAVIHAIERVLSVQTRSDE